MDAYIKKAKRDYSYREDQALGLLFHHKYNIDIAYFELSKYYNLLRKEWSIADKDKFEKLMTKHKKNFDLIQANVSICCVFILFNFSIPTFANQID